MNTLQIGVRRTLSGLVGLWALLVGPTYAQDSATAVNQLRASILQSITAAAQNGLPSQATMRAAAGLEDRCASAGSVLKKPRSTTTALERYKDAQDVRACLEMVKAASISENSARAGGDFGTAAMIQSVANAAWAPVLQRAEQSEAQEKAGADFMGGTFGVGIGFSKSKDRITNAEVAADGTLRATEREKQTPRVILEAHYYGFCQLASCNEAKWGVGPFFGLAAKEDVIEAFAVGIMFGRKDADPTAKTGFSLGIGAVLDKAQKGLARGFSEGQPLPSGETAPAFETKSKWSPLIFFTRSF